MSDDLNLEKDLYRLRIKSMINNIGSWGFEKFLKKCLEFYPEISHYDLFINQIVGSMLAIEYGVKEKDNELLKYTDILILKLESEQNDEENISLGKLFAKLLRKARALCEADMLVSKIMFTFEFTDFSAAFKEKVANIENEHVFSKTNYYSNN